MAQNPLTHGLFVSVFVFIALSLSCCSQERPSAPLLPATGRSSLPLGRLFPELNRPEMVIAGDGTPFVPSGYSSFVTGDFDGDGTIDTALVIRQAGGTRSVNECHIGIISFLGATAYRRHLFTPSRPSCPGLQLSEDQSQNTIVLVAYSGSPNDCDRLLWVGSEFASQPCPFVADDDTDSDGGDD